MKDFYLRTVVVKFNVKFLGLVELHPGKLTPHGPSKIHWFFETCFSFQL